jgi:Dolichyl-phosphate-mannose-protein mannosyltransferase
MPTVARSRLGSGYASAVRSPRLDHSRDKGVLVGVWTLAVVGCFLGLVFPSHAGARVSAGEQALDIARVLATAALAVVLVLGPGLALRCTGRLRRLELGFVPLPGIGTLALTGCLAWAAAAAGVSPRAVCALVLVPILVVVLVAVLQTDADDILRPDERGTLLVVGAALGVAIGRALWSLGPPGELSAGTIFRTLEVGDRSDPRLQFGVVQLISQGASPFGALAHSYFGEGYSFADRGPLAGLASAPVVLLSGGRPPAGYASAPWSPFDAQGFMSYRLAMMTLASTAFLSVWTLARRLAGAQAARLTLLLAATTPFLVHEIWFTWPKLLAASLILLAAIALIDGRPYGAGLLAGAGYLAHPIALLSVPTLVLVALWPPGETRLRRPRYAPGLLLCGGVATWLAVWRLVNWSHFTQQKFFSYVTEAGRSRALQSQLVRALGGHPAPVTLTAWLSDRLVSLANTLIPLRLFLLSASDVSINAINPRCSPFCAGSSPAVVHFFFQYWTALPFAVGILFFPMLLVSLARATRQWPWAITATVLVPFVLFTIYWGDADTGMLREGLQTWVLTLVVVVAIEQQRSSFPWLKHASLRGVLALRAVEVLLVATLPTLLTRHRAFESRYWITDIVALSAMVGLCAALGWACWREKPKTRRPREACGPA